MERNKRGVSGLLVCYGRLPQSYTDVQGTSERVLRNKGIKYKHLQSGCRELAFVGNWEMNCGGEQEACGSRHLYGMGSRLWKRLEIACRNLSHSSLRELTF
jgi:hypothetical protein